MTAEEIENLIRDYSWMAREVSRLERCLEGAPLSSGSWGVAQYGIEAAMPRGSAGKSQVELAAMDERETRIYKRIMKYKNKVIALEHASDLITGDIHKAVYDCLLFDQMSMREIAIQLGVSRDKVKQTKEEVLYQLSQHDHFQQLLKSSKKTS
ncbi:sigma-70 family RNA polymerase sigma factor [Mesobacillus stamsii]|uniref:Sigma-70 family RNA polymerase sigma factor n=1 Tax=Mesobacillus stamsii TaxID=225347 RepID=A0ABU0FSA6_9BACI|nr:sigma-70 family RNA polymerase sigma factor [Mesobacillus stamsii]MDQ0412710.1 hypothetical protein [Mesobacillus stamsii]